MRTLVFTAFFCSKYILSVAISFSIVFFVSSCDSKQESPVDLKSNKHADLDSLDKFDGRHLLASGITLQRQQDNTVRHRISADTVSIVPRGFGAFNLRDINEVLLENSHIEIFPVASGNAGGGEADSIDFTDSIKDSFGIFHGINWNFMIMVHMTKIHFHFQNVNRIDSTFQLKGESFLRGMQTQQFDLTFSLYHYRAFRYNCEGRHL